MAQQVGAALAVQNARLVFGVDNSKTHLPDIAYQSFAAAGGTALGIFRSRSDMLACPYQNIIPVVAGMERGAGWEAVIVLSARALIIIGGRAGTMQEVAIALQAGIPVIALKGSGGFADCLDTDTYLVFQKGEHYYSAKTPSEAVTLAMRLAQYTDT